MGLLKIFVVAKKKSTAGNHFIFLSEMAQVLYYGTQQTVHAMLAAKKVFLALKKNIRTNDK